MLIVCVWLGVIAAVFLYLLCTRLGRAYLRTFFAYLKTAWPKVLAACVVAFALLCAVSHFFSKAESFNDKSFDMVALRSFAKEEIRRGVLEGIVVLGDSLSMLTPEVAAVVPTAIMSLRDISGKEVVPVLTAPEPHGIVLQVVGFKSFKNRGINSRKLLQKRLGRDYEVYFDENRDGSFLRVYYNGRSWDEERLLALPSYRAAYREGVKPENVMAFVSVAEEFKHGRVNFIYEPDFVGLDSVARLLKKSADSTGSDEQMFKNAFFAIAAPFMLPSDSSEADVYAKNAVRYAEYYKRFGL